MSKSDLAITVADGAAFTANAGEDAAAMPALSLSAVTASFCLTALIFWRCSPFPPHDPLSWIALGIYTAGYIFAAFALYALILSVFYRLFSCDQEISLQALAYKSAALVGWVPPFVFLQRQHSLWIAVALPIVAVNFTIFVRDTAGRLEQNTSAAEIEEPLLFSLEPELGVTGSIRPALVAAVGLQCGIGLLLFDQPLCSGICLAFVSTYAAWRLLTKSPVSEKTANRPQKSLRFLSQLMVPLALTALVLLPFHKNKVLAGDATGLLNFSWHAARPVQATVTKPHGSFFSGFILVPLENPNKQLLKPPRVATNHIPGNAITKPLEINFDGVYWYFDPMEARPHSDAPTVRGDSIKATIHSTYDGLVAMVAHQSLSQPIAMSCCRAMRVQITNAEGLLGPIHLEIMLKNTAQSRGADVISLGTVLIPSTAENHGWIYQQPVDETLTFRFPAASRLKEFNEITVAVEPELYETQRGAHLAIRKFTLVP